MFMFFFFALLLFMLLLGYETQTIKINAAILFYNKKNCMYKCMFFIE